MGRKKKSKQDTRGYSQGPAVARPSQTAASTATSANQDKHDDISTNNKSSISSQTATQSSSNVKNLLTTLLPQSSANTTSSTTAATTTLAPHKFHTRLTTITSTLLSLTFTPSQIQSVVLALQYDITLESALDWLCLHLDTDDLPSVFVDHNGGIKLLCLERNGGERSLLSVVRSGNKRDYGGSESEEGGGKSNNRMVNVVKMNEGRERDEVERKRQLMEEEEERVKEEQKRRLLLQYEYEQDDNDDDDRQQQQVSDTNTTQQQEQQQQQQHDISTKAQPQEQSPLQIQLGQEELKLQTLEADLANDANNYMRSKFEMKELQKEVKKMRQVVIGLRRKVEREDITINLLENTEVCS